MSGPPTPNEPPREPEPKTGWAAIGALALDALPAIAGAIGFVGFIALIGGAIQWTRFWAAELPADQAVRVIPRAELVTIGAVSAIAFTLLGLAAVLLVYLLDRRAGQRTLGLLAVVVIELLIAAALIDLDTVETLIAVVVIAGVAAAIYKPLREEAPRIAARFARPDEEDPLLVAARTGLTHATQRRVTLIAAAEEQSPEARRAMEPALDQAKREADAAQRELEATRARRSGPVDWKRFVPAASAAAAGLALAWALEGLHLFVVLLAPVVLFVALAGIARATRRFAWYGLAVFFSVPLFGAVVSAADVADRPQVQPIAVARKSDDRAMCGVYVTQTDDRLYIGRLEPKEPGSREPQERSGRIFWIPLDDVDVVSIGELQDLDDADANARELLKEIYADRAHEAPRDFKNKVTVRETETQNGATRTVTTEEPVDVGRPAERPDEPPPTRCTIADLE
ncbi:MAG TPA: hypothetical protein VHF89_11855 [Solirubrobacteraceae bacterium]|nr:hypothetical protein [Solirubrobacteraceae bacterium]